MSTFKELKAKYKEMKFKMGVFQIRNTDNNKVYISSSLDLFAAWNSQKFQLNAGMHSNDGLQKDWNLFGCDHFVYEILDEIKPSEDVTVNYAKEIKALEDIIIENIQPFNDNGYNLKKSS